MEDTETLYDAALPAPNGKISVTGSTVRSTACSSASVASATFSASASSSVRTNGAPRKRAGFDTTLAEPAAKKNAPKSSSQTLVLPVVQHEKIKLSKNAVPRKNKIAAHEKTKTNKMRKQMLDLPIEASYPRETFLPKKRYNLRLEDETAAFTSAVYEDCQQCIICKEEKENEELVMCQGVPNGLPRKVNCPSVFHFTCLTTYNVDRFGAQYAALPECADGIFCPLHHCAVCSVDKRKQSSFAGYMIECALCFRSYHESSCIPAGYRKISVRLRTDSARLEKQAKKTIEMIICPSHVDFETIVANGTHRENCYLCEKTSDADDNEELTQCSTCLYSFHAGCKEVETVDGKPIADQCGNCACRTTFKLGMPVYYRNLNSWSLAVGKRWEEVDDEAVKSLPHFGKVGYVLLYKEGSGSRPSRYMVEHVRNIVPFRPYLNGQQMNQTERKRNAIYNNCEKLFNAALPGYRKTFNKIDRCTYSTNCKDPLVYDDFDFCNCTGANKCATHDCFFHQMDSECPVGCKKPDGKDCENRKIANKYFHPRVELRGAGSKGYGIFATSPICKGEFLFEYVGEIIDEELANKKIQMALSDSQAPLYMMDCKNGLIIDSARHGNLSRFVNHACFPNTMVNLKSVCYEKPSRFTPGFEEDGKRTVKHTHSVERFYFVAIKDIEKDEEITFDYQMESKIVGTCTCGSTDCAGTLAGLSALEKNEE